jgi:hypothetical protein
MGPMLCWENPLAVRSLRFGEVWCVVGVDLMNECDNNWYREIRGNRQ